MKQEAVNWFVASGRLVLFFLVAWLTLVFQTAVIHDSEPKLSQIKEADPYFMLESIEKILIGVTKLVEQRKRLVEGTQAVLEMAYGESIITQIQCLNREQNIHLCLM